MNSDENEQWMLQYLSILKDMRNAAANNASALPALASNLGEISSRADLSFISKDWPRINEELLPTVEAVNDFLEKELQSKNQFVTKVKQSYDEECKRLEFLLSSKRRFFWRLFHPISESSINDIRHKIEQDKEEGNFAFAIMCQFVDCESLLRDSIQGLRIANGQPPPPRPYQVSFCGRTEQRGDRVKPSRGIDEKVEPEVLQQRAFIKVNEALHKVVMDIAITLKFDNRKPFTIHPPQFTVDLPDFDKGGRPAKSTNAEGHPGYRQRDIAAMFGVSEAQIANWENGRTRPPLGYSKEVRYAGDAEELARLVRNYKEQKRVRSVLDPAHRQTYEEGETESFTDAAAEAERRWREGK